MTLFISPPAKDSDHPAEGAKPQVESAEVELVVVGKHSLVTKNEIGSDTLTVALTFEHAVVLDSERVPLNLQTIK